MDTIVLDTETTGLIKPDASNILDQPRIIEIFAIRFDKRKNVVDEFEELIYPNQMVEEFITKITGITNDDLEGKPEFSKLYRPLCDFFRGAKTLVAHNCSFDVGMLAIELQRIDRHFQFPWPDNQICTVEKSYHIKNRRMKLGELYKLATGNDRIKGAHRARADTMALADCYWWLKKEKHL